MYRRSRWMLALLIALLWSAVFSAAASGDFRSEAPNLNEDLVDDTGFGINEWIPAWTVIRSDLGFGTPSDQWLAQLANRTQGETTIEEFGVPLTRREVREIGHRETFNSQLTAVESRASALPGFAGLYVEIRPNGKTRAVVATTERVNRRDRDAVRSATTYKSRVRFRVVDYSLADLQHAFDTAMLDADTLGIHSAHIDIPSNQIVVGIDPATDEPTAVAARESADAADMMNNDMMTVEWREADVAMTCTGRSRCSSPLRGGVEADNRNPNRSRCTSGFIVDGPSGDPAMLWSAHCGENGDEVRIGFLRGPSGDRFLQFTQSGTVDAALVSITNDQKSRHIYQLRRDKFQKVGTNVPTAGSMRASDLVCLHGIKVGRSCGRVVTPLANRYNITEQTGGTTTAPINTTTTYSQSFTYRLTLPGDWDCTSRNGSPNNVGGNSGGPITTTRGSTGLGIASTCLGATRTTTTDAAGVITSTSITLRGTHLADALARTGATMR